MPRPIDEADYFLCMTLDRLKVARLILDDINREALPDGISRRKYDSIVRQLHDWSYTLYCRATQGGSPIDSATVPESPPA